MPSAINSPRPSQSSDFMSFLILSAKFFIEFFIGTVSNISSGRTIPVSIGEPTPPIPPPVPFPPEILFCHLFISSSGERYLSAASAAFSVASANSFVASAAPIAEDAVEDNEDL